MSSHVRQTLALTGDGMTSTNGRAMRSKNVAHTRSAILSPGVSVETRFASLALRSFGVVQALEALASGRVAASGKAEVDVVVARTGFARPTGNVGISKEIIGTAVAVCACITPFAVADHMRYIRTCIQATRIGVLHPTSLTTWTQTRLATARITWPWVAIVTIRTPLAAVAAGEVSAAEADSGFAVALVRPPAAQALPAVGEAEMPPFALAAPLSVGVRLTRALSCDGVADSPS